MFWFIDFLRLKGTDMRLFFFRHADPNYNDDDLTEKGEKEAVILAKHIKSFNLDNIYVSPLGRAKKTAKYSLDELNKKAVECDWLKEFTARFFPDTADEETLSAYYNELKRDPVTGKTAERIVWDIMPAYFSGHPELFDVNRWMDSKIVAASDMKEVYEYVTSSFDKLMSQHGYERNGSIYRVTKGNEKRLGFFCHFGITSVFLSHLWNISPFVTLQFLAMAPTSVTEVVTEEREKGIAIFRALRIGDISHLTEENEPPSFSARFCERFENENERH